MVFFPASPGSPNIRRQYIMVPVFPDFVYESTETLKVDLALDPSTSGFILNPDVSEVAILDNDGKSSNPDMHDV